jgi:hypothetical protein
MNEVPKRYRNVINPFQTLKEIKSAIKFIERMISTVKDHQEIGPILGHDRPLRDWSKNA